MKTQCSDGIAGGHGAFCFFITTFINFIVFIILFMFKLRDTRRKNIEMEKVGNRSDFEKRYEMGRQKSGLNPGIYYFTHLETGYTMTDRNCPGRISAGRYCLPDPEYSNPNNKVAIDRVSDEVPAGVYGMVLETLLKKLDERHKSGMFLSTPYFAEKASAPLKKALQNHIVAIHMHEDWRTLVNKPDSELRDYIASEKARLESAIGARVYIFSYGPGITFWMEEGRPITEDDEIKMRKIFKAVADAGFMYVQTTTGNREYLPLGLTNLIEENGYTLIGLPHSFELHTTTGLNQDGMARVDDAFWRTR
jgi:hypothetical protein